MLAFANGAQVEAEIVIGADGVRSVTRRALYGDDNPTYTGQMVWRALLSASDVPAEVLEPKGHTQWVGPGCHFMGYYIRRGKLVNIVTQQDTDKWVEEGWSTRGDPDEMRLSFPNPEPRLEKLLSLVTECSKWGLFQRGPSRESGPRPRATDRRRGACHAAQCRARRLPAFPGRLHPCALARGLPRSHRGLCQFPPHPHPARAWGAAALLLQCSLQAHARDSAAQKASIASGTSSVHGSSDWVWIRSHWRMGQRAFRSCRLCCLSLGPVETAGQRPTRPAPSVPVFVGREIGTPRACTRPASRKARCISGTLADQICSKFDAFNSSAFRVT